MVCTCVNELKRLQSGGSCTTLMTYSFVTQPASSTSCAHYARRLTYRRPRVTVGCAAGSQTTCERFFLLPGRHPHSGKTREQKSGRQTLAENPFSNADRLDRFYSSRCATHTMFSNGPFFSDARSGYGHAGPSPDAGEWRSDGSAEWDGAERTYYRRAGGRRCWDRL